MASGFPEDDRPLRKVAHDVGQDLSTLSIEELSERIALLESEIERLKLARGSKGASKQAADAFFKL